MTKLVATAQELHDAADAAAFHGDFKTADALRLLEGNARGGEVIRHWAYENLTATENEIASQVFRLAVAWGASEKALYNEVMSVYRDID